MICASIAQLEASGVSPLAFSLPMQINRIGCAKLKASDEEMDKSPSGVCRVATASRHNVVSVDSRKCCDSHNVNTT